MPSGDRTTAREVDAQDDLRARLVAARDLEIAPMVPGWRQLTPQLLFSGALPVLVYALLRPHVSSDAIALSAVTVFPFAQIGWDRVRHGRSDPVSLLILAALVVGVVGALTLHGSTLLLKIRESAFTGLFGLTCLGSLLTRRPLMFTMAKAFASEGDPVTSAAFDQRWQLPTVPRRFRLVTLVWGVGLVVETALRVVLALSLSTGIFLVVGQLVGLLVLAGLITYSVVATRRAETYLEKLLLHIDGAPPAVIPTAAA